jgi:hypothetical protein
VTYPNLSSKTLIMIEEAKRAAARGERALVLVATGKHAAALQWGPLRGTSVRVVKAKRLRGNFP